MDDIVWMTERDQQRMMEALLWSRNNGRSFRVLTGSDRNGTWVKWDAGNTGWTEPIYSE